MSLNFEKKCIKLPVIWRLVENKCQVHGAAGLKTKALYKTQHISIQDKGIVQDPGDLNSRRRHRTRRRTSQFKPKASHKTQDISIQDGTVFMICV